MSDKEDPGKDRNEKPASGEKQAPEKTSQKPPVRPGRAALVWLVILLGLGALLLFRDYGPSRKVDLTQTEFEQALRTGRIATAVLVSENDGVFTVEGRIRPAGTAAREGGKSAAPGDGTAFYRSRVIFSEKLDTLLANTSVKVDSNNSGLWNFLMVGILPVLILVAVIYFISMRQMRMNGQGALDFGKSKARMIPPDELNVKFDDIAGADEAKEEIHILDRYPSGTGPHLP